MQSVGQGLQVSEQRTPIVVSYLAYPEKSYCISDLIDGRHPYWLRSSIQDSDS